MMRTQHITKTTKKHSVIITIDDADLQLHDVTAAIRMVEVELEYGDDDAKRFLPFVEFNIGSLVDTPLSNEEIVGSYLTALINAYNSDINEPLSFPAVISRIVTRLDGDNSNAIYKLVKDICEQVDVLNATMTESFDGLSVEIVNDSITFNFTTYGFLSTGLF